MTLYMIGIGLCDEQDITLKGLAAIKTCEKVYLESYTSLLQVPLENLEKLYGKKITLADRQTVERRAYEILEDAKKYNVAFLVVGDVFGATTHTDLYLRAKAEHIHIEVINNVSILNAIGIVGLELYKYGKTTSIPFQTESFNPETPYLVIKENQRAGLHTLVLLDLRPLEKRYMTVNEGLLYLKKIEEKLQEGIITKDTKVIGCARLGCPDMIIIRGTVEDVLTKDFGKPLHSIIIPGKQHFIEEEAVAQWDCKKE